ncbi:thermonuclease family protein [Afifella sp. H1R]|uniref:thermonuclease family protein n=1 Tax=Afifella sp. H1R TaxID=2908841 RepID=UPI001F3FF6CF|nr:thermonuclease family protein [Afifella sp. H1R]MCF1502217.1 thermonuclease family protein [Afifella sp. H1R]
MNLKQMSLSRRWLSLALSIVTTSGAVAGEMLPICSGGNRAARKVTCLVDGDTGWESGIKWRAIDVDTPEISHAECDRERELGERARDRLRELMAGGYTIEWADRRGSLGRELATIRLSDGRDAGKVLIQEGLSQRWPNEGNRWCEHESSHQ